MTSLLSGWLSDLGPASILLAMAVVFAESGLLVGFFLPGDSLLFVAGLMIASGAIGVPLPLAILGIALAAIAGDQLGFGLGRALGPRMLRREGSRFPSARHVREAQAFFDRHGPRAVVLARLVPVARTVVPVVAGVGAMRYRRFVAFNVLGGVGWVSAMMLGGYYLGGVSVIAAHVDVFAVAVVAISCLPGLVSVVRRRRSGVEADGAEHDGGTEAAEDKERAGSASR